LWVSIPIACIWVPPSPVGTMGAGQAGSCALSEATLL